MLEDGLDTSISSADRTRRSSARTTHEDLVLAYMNALDAGDTETVGDGGVGVGWGVWYARAQLTVHSP